MPIATTTASPFAAAPAPPSFGTKTFGGDSSFTTAPLRSVATDDTSTVSIWGFLLAALIPGNFVLGILNLIQGDAGAARAREIADANREFEIGNFEKADQLLTSVLNDIAPEVEGLGDFLSAKSEAFFADVPGKIEEITGDAKALSPEIIQGFKDRAIEGMGLLQGLGDQAKIDATQAFRNSASNIQQDLTRRGLANTSVAPSGAAFVQEGLQRTIGDINAQLNQQAVGLQQASSFDTLQAQIGQQGFLTETAFQGLGLNIDSQLAANQSALQFGMLGPLFKQGAVQNLVDFAGSTTVAPPFYSPINTQIGAQPIFG